MGNGTSPAHINRVRSCVNCIFYWQDLKTCSIGPTFLGYIKKDCSNWEDKGTEVPKWEQQNPYEFI